MSRPLPNNPPPSLTMQFANMGLQDQQQQQWSPSPLPAPPQPSPTRSGFQQQQQRERDHPQMHSFIHPQAQAITQRHPQAQMIHQQWQQQQQQQQQQRIPRSTGFQPSSPVRAGPSSPYENRQTFTPTSSFPNGIPPGGIPGANALAQQPPRPPSMAGSYSQPVPQQHTLPRPPSMAPTSYSQPAPPRPSPGYNQFPPTQAVQQPQIFAKPPLHPASPTRSQYSLPHTEPVAFPPPPVHPDSPTRRTRELSPVRQHHYQIEQRVASSQPASRNTSPQRPMSVGQFPMQPQHQPVRQSSFTNEQRTFPQPVSRNNQPPRPASISQFPPSPVPPHSPVRHNSYQTEQRTFPQPGSRDASPQRQTNNAHFPPSVPAPTPPTRRDTSPHRELPTPGSARPSAHQPQTQTQRPVPTSSFPQGTTPSAVSQAQQSLMGRAFPQPPTATPSRPLPSMQYSGPPPAQTQMPPNSFPRSRPTQPAPTIREPSPTRPIRLPNLDDPAPQPVSPHIRSRSPSSSRPPSQAIPQINFSEPPSGVPMINFPDDPQPPPRARQEAAVPKIVIPDDNVPQINFGSYEDNSNSPSQNSASSSSSTTARFDPQPTPSYSSSKANGLACARCRLVIVGRMVSSGGPNGSLRWHPACFACIVCGELLEHVSSYERNGNMYCHLDYHEKFAPPCSHCQTPIIDEEYICLDEPGLGGQRSYHAQHFFCAECGDPFLQPGQDLSSAEYIIHKGYPYCEACHVRLRMPLCKRKGCGKRIREWESGVDALGGKWCTGCFRCAGCDTPLGERYYDRDGGAYCQDCFSIILRNDM